MWVDPVSKAVARRSQVQLTDDLPGLSLRVQGVSIILFKCLSMLVLLGYVHYDDGVAPGQHSHIVVWQLLGRLINKIIFHCIHLCADGVNLDSKCASAKDSLELHSPCMAMCFSKCYLILRMFSTLNKDRILIHGGDFALDINVH